jgi:hypothetical protein
VTSRCDPCDGSLDSRVDGERGFQQQPFAAAQAEAPEHLVAQLGGTSQSNLSSGRDLQRYLSVGQGIAQRQDSSLDPSGGVRHVPVDVGSADHRLHIDAYLSAGELDRSGHVRRPVIDARQQVAVKIDHARCSTNAPMDRARSPQSNALAASTPPMLRVPAARYRRRMSTPWPASTYRPTPGA